MKIIQEAPLEKVLLKNMEISLLASGDGTEVILYKLYENAELEISPVENSSNLLHLTILSGSLTMKNSNGEVVLEPRNSVHACPVEEHTIFTATTEVELLYVTSQPQFHIYRTVVKDMMDIAVTVEKNDGYLGNHCDKIKDLSLMLGKVVGLDEDKLYILSLASYLHDIGKLKVPNEILKKPSSLTDEEYNIIKMHTIWGREILAETRCPDLIKAGEIIEQHHERYDGLGYPHQLKGEEIRIEASIIAVVDAYDAMRTDRAYRKGMSVDKAFNELLINKGKMFHPYVVDAFLFIKNKLI